MAKIVKKGFNLIDEETGEIYSPNFSPQFEGYSYDEYVQDFKAKTGIRYLEAMSAYEYDSAEALKPLLVSSERIAEQKYDGHRGILTLTKVGNRAFSKRISKKTNWFTENSDCIPHIRDANVPDKWLGSVLDGEFVVQSSTGNSMDVQSIMGSLPPKALENQMASGFANYQVFDILYVGQLSVMPLEWYKRKWLSFLAVKAINNPFILLAPIYVTPSASHYLKKLIGSYIKNTKQNLELLSEFFDKNVIEVIKYEELYAQMLEEGKEGLIIKDTHGIYELGKKSKAFIKMKNCETFDCVIMGYQEATRLYDGKELDKKDGVWDYWGRDAERIEVRANIKDMLMDEWIAITKPYAKGWIGAIDCGVWKNEKLVKVCECKGLSDKDLEYIKNNKEKLIGEVIEVSAQGIISKDTGSLRHPRVSRLQRIDKNSKDCTWESHIRA